jgi:hypothetical protein
MNIPKIGGLIASIYANMSGIPFSTDASMLFEEMVNSGSKLAETIRELQTIAKAQVVGNAEAAKIALDDARSAFITDEQRIAQISKARDLYEKCYAELLNIPTLANLRAEVAFNIATCNAALGVWDLYESWLASAANDFKRFGSSETPLPIAEMMGTTAKGMTFAGTGLAGVLIFGGVLLAPHITIPSLLVGGGGGGFLAWTGIKKTSENKLKQLQIKQDFENLKIEKSQALQQASRVQKLLTDFQEQRRGNGQEG